LTLPAGYDEAWKRLTETQAEALCCTPTFLDLLIQANAEAASEWSPHQITLGGEPIRPRAGERFRTRFPGSRFTLVYASAELGVVLKSQQLNGWYDAEQLQQRGRSWRVREGLLEIESEGSWRNTGDLVEQDGTRLRFLGRADSVANVAGAKVNLDAIAGIAEEVEGVRMAMAFSEPSPITGQIVALRFDTDTGMDEQEVQRRLEEHLRTRLRKEAWPRRIEQGPIKLGANAKRRNK
jgi:acyl-coenzyme A synthetase/AMP-(fatty) acid ligase